MQAEMELTSLPYPKPKHCANLGVSHGHSSQRWDPRGLSRHGHRPDPAFCTLRPCRSARGWVRTHRSTRKGLEPSPSKHRGNQAPTSHLCCEHQVKPGKVGGTGTGRGCSSSQHGVKLGAFRAGLCSSASVPQARVPPSLHTPEQGREPADTELSPV